MKRTGKTREEIQSLLDSEHLSLSELDDLLGYFSFDEVYTIDEIIKGSGLDKKLMEELAASGAKYDPDNVLMITKTPDGKLVWLEKGTTSAGLEHIITRHADDFMRQGITQAEIPNFINEALSKGTIVGYQGRELGRPIYEFIYNGKTYQVAITVGDNGFIVGANPR